jgi:hypothetical protein
MLFDLRGRGRRRTVQIIYLGLALLMGGGLVLFGVGSFGGTGILSSVSGREGSNAASFSDKIKKYEKQTRLQPTNVAAWEHLTTEQLHQAGGEGYYEGEGQGARLTDKGKELFSATARSWERYLALNPRTPNLTLAKQMLRIYNEEGLNQPAAAVEALQIIVAAEPSSAAYYRYLAQYAYKAKNTRVGDLAARKAVALAPPEARASIKKELEALKKSPSGETLTGHTNGKAFTVKQSSNGSYTGAVPTTTPAPAGGTTTTKK